MINIGVEEGKIAKISKERLEAHKTIDVKGNIILPGLIDAHVHFREPGMEYKEDFRTGSMAAAHGGFTTILEMPNTIPITDNVKEFRRKIKIASRKSIVDFGLHAGVDLAEVRKIIPLKPASFKVFMEDTKGGELLRLFNILSGSPVPVTFHCENKSIIEECAPYLEGGEPLLYPFTRPTMSEEVAVAEAIAFSYHYNHPVHICHISSRKALQLIKSSNAPVTCEVTPHHLLLDSGYLEKFGSLAKTNPPLRPPEEGVSIEDLDKIDMIATDHAPHTLKEKEIDIWKAPPGIPNLEVTLKLLITLFAKKKLKLAKIKEMLCERPAKIFGLKYKGFIKIGMDADFVIVDIKKNGRISADKFYSKAHYTPFEGFKYIGEPVMTIKGGRILMEDGEIFEGKGVYVGSDYKNTLN